MALLNRFSKLNDRGETGIFTFIVTKSVTRDFHRDATTKDFCFGYHRWAISFQRPTEKVLGVHLLLRNPSPSTACVVDFTLTLLNREHFSQNEVYSKRQAKFTITNPMQGVSRWIQMSDLIERNFSNETGEFLFELALSNMTTIFECDIQLNPATLTQYKQMLRSGSLHPQTTTMQTASQQPQSHLSSHHHHGDHHGGGSGGSGGGGGAKQRHNVQLPAGSQTDQLINLETNYFTFGAFDWSLTIVPLVTSSAPSSHSNFASASASAGTQENASSSSLPSSNDESSGSTAAAAAAATGTQATQREPVCRIYLNRLSGLDCLCRVKYRVILGHHQASESRPAEFVDSRLLDQISDAAGRIRGYQFRNTNIMKLISLRNSSGQQQSSSADSKSSSSGFMATAASAQAAASASASTKTGQQAGSALDLRVHIEMFCANSISEARVPLQRKANEPQVSNCSDRNKQAWCVESDSEIETVRLKLFFMDLQSVPRNHIRYISWIAYVVRRDSKSGSMKESMAVKNSPHCNYYLQDGIDMGTIMDTHIPVKELNESPRSYLEANQLTVHIEWVDSLLLFSHLYSNYDSMATIQRHQIGRELGALQQEFAHLERKYLQSKRSLNQLLGGGGRRNHSQQQQQQARAANSSNHSSSSNNNNYLVAQSNSLDEDEDLEANSEDGLLEDGDEEDEEEDVLEADFELGGAKQRSWQASSVNFEQSQPPARQQQQPPLQAQAQHSRSHRNHPLGGDGNPLTGIQSKSLPMPSVQQQQQQQHRQLMMGSAAYPARGQRQSQRSPMSTDERLKFSSSTPPSCLQLHQPMAPASTAALEARRQSQTPLRQPQTCQLAPSASFRRLLPRQPPPLPQAHEAQQQQQALADSARQMDSQATYQAQQQQQQQQIRVAPPATIEVRAPPLLLEAKMGALALGIVDKGSINEPQQLYAASAAAPGARFEPGMNVLMNERLRANQPDAASAAELAARYQQQQQLAAMQSQFAVASYESPLTIGAADETQTGYFRAAADDDDANGAAPCQHNRFVVAAEQTNRQQPMGDAMKPLHYVTAVASGAADGALATSSSVLSHQQQQQQHRLSQPLATAGYHRLAMNSSKRQQLEDDEGAGAGGDAGVGGAGYQLGAAPRRAPTSADGNQMVGADLFAPDPHFIGLHRPSY